jgi:hypothetical protein
MSNRNTSTTEPKGYIYSNRSGSTQVDDGLHIFRTEIMGEEIHVGFITRSSAFAGVNVTQMFCLDGLTDQAAVAFGKNMRDEREALHASDRKLYDHTTVASISSGPIAASLFRALVTIYGRDTFIYCLIVTKAEKGAVKPLKVIAFNAADNTEADKHMVRVFNAYRNA